MPRHVPRGKPMMPSRKQVANPVRAHMPPRNRMGSNPVRAHMPPRNRMGTNPGFRGTTNHTKRTHHNPGKPMMPSRKQVANPGRGGGRPNQRGNPNPGSRGNVHHTTRTHPNPGRGGGRPNRRGNPNPVNAGRGGGHPKQRGNPNPGRGGGRPNRRGNPKPVHKHVQDKRKIVLTVMRPMPQTRKPMSVVEMLKQKLKANRELSICPRVQRPAVRKGVRGNTSRKRSVVEMLKQKLKSNHVLTLHPKVQVAPVTVQHAPMDTVCARPVSYQPRYQVQYDSGNMTPHSSQQGPSVSAASAQSHKMVHCQADNENIPETTDENLLFLKSFKAELIDKVKNVDRIVDYLDLSNENAAIVRAQPTDHAMMRKLLEFTTSTHAAERLVNVLWEQVGDVMEDLNEFSDAEDEAEDDAEDDAGDEAEDEAGGGSGGYAGDDAGDEAGD